MSDIPAFPTGGRYCESDGMKHQEPDSPGMTLRDYFAAHAMMIAYKKEGLIPMSDVADVAYQIADAMLAARGE